MGKVSFQSCRMLRVGTSTTTKLFQRRTVETVPALPCSPRPSPGQQPFHGPSPKCCGTEAQPSLCWLPHSAQGHPEASPPDQQGRECSRVCRNSKARSHTG